MKIVIIIAITNQKKIVKLVSSFLSYIQAIKEINYTENVIIKNEIGS